MPPSNADSFTLSELYQDVREEDEGNSSQQKLLEKLQAQASLLTAPEKLRREPGDLEYVEKLSSWIAKSILPDNKSVSYDELPEEEPSQERHAAIALSQEKATLGLKTLSYLYSLQDASQISSKASQGQPLNPQILLSLIAFSTTRDPWTTPDILSTSQTFLARHHDYIHSSEFIATHLLQGFIRPLFSKSKPGAITSTGRKAMPTSAPPRRHQIGDLDRASKPWKYEVVYTVTVFEWAVDNVSQETLSQSWNLFIPPLITLLDNTTSTPLLSRALTTLKTFLPKFGTKLLIQTGLAEVFEDAVTPILHFLPSITPLEESTQLVPRAYEALFTLCDVRFPVIPEITTEHDKNAVHNHNHGKDKDPDKDASENKNRIAFLDRILRNGIISSYHHVAEHPAILKILLANLATILPKLGIHSVKHLKDTIPLVSAVLTDPFSASASQPTLLISAIKALRAVVLNAWPRMRSDEVHRMEVVKALVLCWRNVCEEGGEGGRFQEGREDEGEGEFERQQQQDRGEIIKELKITGRVFVKAVEGGGGEGDVVRSELGTLVGADPRIGELFGIEKRGGES